VPEKILLVNGPCKGEIVNATTAKQFIVEEPGLPGEPGLFASTAKRHLYNVGRFVILGHMVTVGYFGPGKPSDADIWDALVRPEVSDFAETGWPDGH